MRRVINRVYEGAFYRLTDMLVTFGGLVALISLFLRALRGNMIHVRGINEMSCYVVIIISAVLICILVRVAVSVSRKNAAIKRHIDKLRA